MEATDGSVQNGGSEGAGKDAHPAALAKQMASTTGSVIQQEASSFASSVQSKVQAGAAEQTKTASRAIGDFATAIQHAGDELAGKDQTMAAQLIKGAADRLGDLAGTLNDKRPEEMLQGVREFGRRNPVGLAAFGVLAGLAIGRLVRSSVEPMAEEAGTQGSGGGGGASTGSSRGSSSGASTGASGGGALSLSTDGRDAAGPEQLVIDDASVDDSGPGAVVGADGAGKEAGQ